MGILCSSYSVLSISCIMQMTNDQPTQSKLGFSEEAKVNSAEEYDKSKEKGGFVAGKHIDGRMKWWFQR